MKKNINNTYSNLRFSDRKLSKIQPFLEAPALVVSEQWMTFMYPNLKLKTRFEHIRDKLPRTQLYFKGLHHILFWYMNSLKHEKKSECNSSQFCCLRKFWDFFQVQASSINIGQPIHYYHGFPWHCKNLVNGHYRHNQVTKKESFLQDDFTQKAYVATTCTYVPGS